MQTILVYKLLLLLNHTEPSQSILHMFITLSIQCLIITFHKSFYQQLKEDQIDNLPLSLDHYLNFPNASKCQSHQESSTETHALAIIKGI